MTESTSRFTLRQLPLPAKLVVTAFLMAVGLGYTAAMVQLHMQDSKTGTPMPTMDDVILKYTGKKKFASQSDLPRPLCRIEKVLSGDRDGDIVGTNMTPAFFAKDGGKYDSMAKAGPEAKAKADAEREGELAAIKLWAQADVKERETAYKNDRFSAPKEKAPAAITPAFKHDDGALKVKSIVNERCARCHYEGAQKPRLDDFSEIAKLLAAPAGATVPEGGGFVRVEEPIGLEKLTQSTHAHLLSFAVLFSLTGLVFAFTNYPAIVRCLLGPLVVVALVADISLWWLARLNEPYGPYFAMCIIGTGGAAGLGVTAQITLSLFNMYGPKGKGVILLLFLLGCGIGGWIGATVIKPGLDAKAEPKAKPEPSPNSATGDPKPATPPVVPTSPPFENVLTGEFKKGGPWGKGKGGMVRAFFDKDDLFEEGMKPQREAEHAALLAWVKTAADARKKSYEADRFELPAELAGKPMTPMMQHDKNFVKVKTLITERCVVCHAVGKDQEERPMENYEQLAKYLVPSDANKKVDAGPMSVPPIPMAKVEPKVEPKSVAPSGPSQLELLVSGPFMKGKPLNAKPGGMVGAFFDKEDEFKQAFKNNSPTVPKLTAEREGEQTVFLAWIKSPADARKIAYEMDKFPLPASLAGKPFTASFKSDDKMVKLKSLLVARCVVCHSDGGEKADVPLEEYDQLLEFMKK